MEISVVFVCSVLVDLHVLLVILSLSVKQYAHIMTDNQHSVVLVSWCGVVFLKCHCLISRSKSVSLNSHFESELTLLEA